MDPVFRATDRHGPERITAGARVQGIQVTVHCYRIGGFLIDTGPPNRAQQITDHLDGRVEHAIITHHHPDHAGAAARLAEGGATVWAHELALEPLYQAPEVSPRTLELWGQPAPVAAECIEDRMTVDGQEVEVVATPGHSEDHVTFHLPEQGWVFTGDVYIGPRVALGPEEDLGSLLESYRRVCALEPTRMFPGHGAVVKDPEHTLTRTIDHFRELAEQARTLQAQGLDPAGIAAEMFDTEEGRFARGRFTYENMVDELLELTEESLGLPGEAG